MNFKSGYGRMSLPYGQSNTDNLFDINGVLVLDSDNEPIKIYNNNLNRFGFGIALGYKTCSCKDWLVDILLDINIGHIHNTLLKNIQPGKMIIVVIIQTLKKVIGIMVSQLIFKLNLEKINW
ncbi:MAG: hypothetical protein CM15mP112_05460 [Flavobacteriales bacterium]|nr:MAG: hypothetical protein CM15mP112_05460 [Flavobacteriales bacterium]